MISVNYAQRDPQKEITDLSNRQKDKNSEIDPPSIYERVAFAPLTLVRSEKPEELQISLQFNEPKFSPREPIEPKPTFIESKEGLKKYTWNVLSDGKGFLDAVGINGLNRRIQMIWWESTRKENIFVRPDPSRSVCVQREELKFCLEAILHHAGLQKNESEAFVAYWTEVFQHQFDPENTPFVLVQLVPSEEVNRYVPEMDVASQTPFELRRFYFLFEPVAQKPEDCKNTIYFESFAIGKNAVLDLGGEVAAEKTSPDFLSRASSSVHAHGASAEQKRWGKADDAKNQFFNQDGYNEAFIKKYIYV